ncbi:histidine phosphatase family protein [Cryptosporangium aurantiacum]|uniref:Probable phosphomutase, MSMEG_4193 family n=1 Tax=Cryptosporangium aurantiacum TaxID=134849 RepID=A0A1M7RIG7_9ACTN|nr:histidine phosphatase family protein [Cryptosporangium aurantiacum]SHN45949.1 probable phosphomutase, MSMEG_4193 family [Cryptosporangium aurantiacum]
MPTLVLLRHGRSTANTSGVLAGWTPGVNLDDHGRKQADAVAERLRPLPLAAIVSSPLDRCQQTLAPVWADRNVAPVIDDRFGECRYGDWTGRKLTELVKEPLWKVVQQHPSAAVFPGPEGEGLATTQSRAVAAVRDWNARVEASHGPDAIWLACSHGDVIKAVLADAYGMHLDLFQRIVVDPCSVSVIRYAETRPFVVRVNDVGGDLTGLLPPPKSAGNEGDVDASDAVVGGGTGAV